MDDAVEEARDDDLSEQFLQLTLVSGLALAVLGLLAAPALGIPSAAILPAVTVALYAALLLLLRAGRVRLTAWLTCWSLWLFQLALTVTQGGGAESSYIIGMVLAVALSAIVLNTTVAVVMTLLTLAAVLVSGSLAASGMLPEPVLPQNPSSIVAVSMFEYGWALSLLVIGGRQLRRAYARTRASASARARAHDDLERLVAKRTTALTEARDAAQKAGSAKSRFLANISHEIRTPLNALVGMTNALLEAPLQPAERELAEIIQTSSNTILTLVSDIIDFTKIETGELVIEHEPVSLRACVESAIEYVVDAARHKSLTLAYSIDPDVPETIISDRVRLRQLLVNLLDNAVKFTPRGEVVLRLSARDVPAPGPEIEQRWVQLQADVVDTGVGIPQESTPEIFETFLQIEETPTRKYGGAGLGLAICKIIVERMYGRIWVDSEPGSGSAFHFTIRAQVTASARESMFAPVPGFAGRSLLIVGAHPVERRDAAQLAERWGLRVIEAARARGALEIVEAEGERLNVALVGDEHSASDEPNAMALARALRELHSARALPIILWSNARGQRPAPDGPVQRVLERPARADSLRGALTRTLQLDDGSRDADVAAASALRVLVVEDNVLNQRIAKILLSKFDLNYDVVADGLEAVRATERARYDVVLMDIQMPRMDGIEATREIRKRSGAARPWIIAMTADALPSDRRQYIECGMNDLLCKPIDPADFRRVLKRASAELGGPRFDSLPTPLQIAAVDAAARDAVVKALVRLREFLRDPGDGPDPLRRFAEEILDSVCSLVESLLSAAERGEHRSMQLAAHSLKSSAAMIGAMELAAYARTIESQAQRQQRPKPAALHEVREQLDRFKPVFYMALDAAARSEPASR